MGKMRGAWRLFKTLLDVPVARTDRFLDLVQQDIRSGVPVPLSERLRLATGGFLRESYIVYQFDRNDRSQYLSDVQRSVRTPELNGQYSLLLKDKMLFGLITRNFPSHDIKSFGVIRNGKVAYAGAAQKTSAVSYLLDLLETQPKLVIKPLDAGGGTDIRRVFREGEQLFVNDVLVSEGGLRDLVEGMKNDLISCFVEQHPEISALYPRTTNTVRLLTMWDVDTHEPFVAAAVLRIGCAASYPADNWSQGGFSAAVDIETGELSKAASYSRGTLTWHSHHPESGAPIEGIVVPEWPAIKARMIDVCRSIPFLEYIGWDIILTADGFKILEGNHYSGVTILQVHRPLLADPRVAAFYKAKGIL